MKEAFARADAMAPALVGVEESSNIVMES